jgi:UPF0755 protein
MAWIEHLVMVCIISFAFYSLLPIQTVHTEEIKKLSIAEGVTSEGIITQLHRSGYDVSFIDSFILSMIGKIHKGELRLKKKFSQRMDFLLYLKYASTPLEKVTLIPGETKEIFMEIVSKQLEINSTKLMNAYTLYSKYAEASISADTYLVPKKMNEKKLIKFLLASSERKYKKIAMKAYGEYNEEQWHRILIIASIIQKEAASNAEMPMIASVIYNRLKKNMRLQMDGTLNYGKYSHVKVTPARIKNDKSTFNTYKHRGLPTSAIGSVSRIAIKAAIYPKKSAYLYFMRNKEGVHDFSKTFKEHRKHINNAK